MPATLLERIELTVLPVTDAVLPEKRARDERGEAHFIVNNYQVCRVAALSLLPGKGYRGNHYHKHKTEGFYLLCGRMRLALTCLASNESAVLELEPGSRFVIPPMVAHNMLALEPLWFIEFTDHPYDKSDDNPYHLA